MSAAAFDVCCGQFALPADDRELSLLAASPVLMQYSKAPEQAYGPAMRAQILSEARREHRAEIGKGLAWLEDLARSDDTVAALLDAEVG